MATTPDERVVPTRAERIIKEARQTAKQELPRLLVPAAAALAVGPARPYEALSTAILLYVIYRGK